MCSPFNPKLREAFEGVYFNLVVANGSFDDPDAGFWDDPPTCLVGIPGIDRVATVTGRSVLWGWGSPRLGAGPYSGGGGVGPR